MSIFKKMKNLLGSKLGSKFGSSATATSYRLINDDDYMKEKQDGKKVVSGSATARIKEDGTFSVEFDEDFEKKLNEMPPEEYAAVMQFKRDFEQGKIDPDTHGRRLCYTCGSVLKNNKPSTTCEKCEKDLV